MESIRIADDQRVLIHCRLFLWVFFTIYSVPKVFSQFSCKTLECLLISVNYFISLRSYFNLHRVIRKIRSNFNLLSIINESRISYFFRLTSDDFFRFVSDWIKVPILKPADWVKIKSIVAYVYIHVLYSYTYYSHAVSWG